MEEKAGVTAVYGPVLQMFAAHAATWVKYPAKDIGLGVGAPDTN